MTHMLFVFIGAGAMGFITGYRGWKHWESVGLFLAVALISLGMK